MKNRLLIVFFISITALSISILALNKTPSKRNSLDLEDIVSGTKFSYTAGFDEYKYVDMIFINITSSDKEYCTITIEGPNNTWLGYYDCFPTKQYLLKAISYRENIKKL